SLVAMAFSRTFCTAGSNNAIRIARMATITNNSVSVNARRCDGSMTPSIRSDMCFHCNPAIGASQAVRHGSYTRLIGTRSSLPPLVRNFWIDPRAQRLAAYTRDQIVGADLGHAVAGAVRCAGNVRHGDAIG